MNGSLSLMSIKIDENFNETRIIDYLKTLDHDDGKWFIPTIEFIFSESASAIFERINRKHESIRGYPAYDRRKLYIPFAYSTRFGIDHDLAKIEKLCRTDRES